MYTELHISKNISFIIFISRLELGTRGSFEMPQNEEIACSENFPLRNDE